MHMIKFLMHCIYFPIFDHTNQFSDPYEKLLLISVYKLLIYSFNNFYFINYSIETFVQMQIKLMKLVELIYINFKVIPLEDAQ